MFKPASARTVTATAPVSSVMQNTAVANLPSVANTALAKFNNTDLQQIGTLKQELLKLDPASVLSFGANVQDEMVKLADQILDHTKSNDVDFIGSKLTDIVVKAKGLNISNLNGNKSNIPLIGTFINKFRANKERVMAEFNTVSEQIEKIVDEVAKNSQGLEKRLHVLEDMYQANTRQYHELDMHAAALRLAIEDMTQQTDAFAASLPANADPFDVQQVADARRQITNMDIMLSNFERLSLSAVQTAPSIRLMQQNGLQLIDKFKIARTHVVPNWKKQFAIAIMVDEQRKATELDTMLTDMSNETARQTATMLKTTSVAIAKANQRGVYDLATLEHVQNELISGIDEVIKVTEEGAKARKTVSTRAGEMKQQLQNKLA